MKEIKQDLVCLGMSAADILVTGIEKGVEEVGDYIADSMILSPGGDALNQAVAASKLGCPTELMTCVGDDWFGNYLKEYLGKNTKIKVSAVEKKECATSVSIVLVEENGERRFIKTLNGSINECSVGDIDLDQFSEHVKILSIGSLGGSRGLAGKDMAVFLRKIKKKGIMVTADMVDNLGGGSYEMLKDVMPYIDYFLPSESEIKILFGETSIEEAADILLNLGVKHVVVKLGEKGVFLKERKMQKYLPAYKARAVDTTGAGDHFVAGFNAALSKSMEFEECVRYGMAAASLAVQTTGTVSVEITDQKVKELMESEMNNQNKR